MTSKISDKKAKITTIIDLRYAKVELLELNLIKNLFNEIYNIENINLFYSSVGSNIRFMYNNNAIEYSIAYYNNGGQIDIHRFVDDDTQENECIKIIDELGSKDILEIWNLIKLKLHNIL